MDRWTEAAKVLQAKNLVRIQHGLAHDLRAPFNAIALQLELLRLMASRPSDATTSGTSRQVRLLSQVEGEVRKLRTGIEALLAQFEPYATAHTFDLSQVVRELGELAAHQAAQEGVQVVIDADDRLRVTSRPDLVRTAILGLLLGELDLGVRGGRLLLRTLRDGGRAWLEVSATPVATATSAEPAAEDVTRGILASQGFILERRADEGRLRWRLGVGLAAPD